MQHFPFKNEYPYLPLKLITEAEVFNSMQYQNVIKVNGIGSFSITDIVRVSIRLPNLVELRNARISVLNLVKDVENKTDLYEKAIAVNKQNT
jgi:hypothetical protein